MEVYPRRGACARQSRLVHRLSRIILVFLALAAVYPAAESAKSLAKKAEAAEKKGDAVQAYLLYSQAAAADPKRRDYWVKSQALRTRALQASPLMPALLADAKPDPAAPAEAEDEADMPPIGETVSKEDIEESRRPLPPAELRSVPGLKTFDIRGDAKQLFTEVVKAFGLDLIFDADYQGGTPQHIRMQDVDFRTALHALQSSTSSFAIPLSDKLLMVYKDTQQKRVEAEPTMAVTLSLPNPVTVQEVQELARAVQQAFEIQKFAIDSSQRLVLMKDRVSKVRAAQALYEQLLTHRPQVVLEVELIDVAESQDLSYGIDLPTSTAMSFLGRRSSLLPTSIKGFRVIPEFMPGFSRYLLAGGGLTTVAIAIADARAFASFSRSRSTSLFRSSLRSLDSQAASLHIGDKYPIITQQYQGGDNSTPAFGLAPTFQFEDLGLTLKATPRVHLDGDISIQLEAEYKVLGNGEFNGIPVIANRKFSSTVRLKQGEWAVVMGILSGTEARTITGLPGLTQIPVLNSILARNTRSVQTGEALIVVKPHIVDAVNTSAGGKAIYLGTESRWSTLP